MVKMSKHERAYRKHYGLTPDDEIDEDDLITFDPKVPYSKYDDW